MARKCFISFKTEDLTFKNDIQKLGIDMIDKSLDEAISSFDEDYIMRKIREDYLADSSVTIHLIGGRSAENFGPWEQRFIKKELQASLYDGPGNRQSGILGLVLPQMHSSIYKGSFDCVNCGGSHTWVNIGDQTVVSEFSSNYYIPNGKCSHTEDDRYCVLATWDEFVKDPESLIEKAYQKRSSPIAAKTKVRP